MNKKIGIIIAMIGMVAQGASATHIHHHAAPSEVDEAVPFLPANKASQSNQSTPRAFAVNVKGFSTSDTFGSYWHEIDGLGTRQLIQKNPYENARPDTLAWNAAADTLYGVSPLGDGTKHFIKFDTSTGITTRISTFPGLKAGQSVQGITIDRNNKCYVSSTDDIDHDTISELYQCDLATGRLTSIGSQTTHPDIHDLVATCDGTLYGIDSFSKTLVTINPQTGVATTLVPLGLSSSAYADNMTYDRENDLLYSYVRNKFGTRSILSSVNKINGEVIFMSESDTSGRYHGAIQSSCGEESETFKLNSSFSGSWYNPETNGQGFFFDVLPQSNAMFASWFTYHDALEGETTESAIGSTDQRWFTLQGELGETNTIEVIVINTTGGLFDDPQAVVSEAVGSMTIEFIDCSTANVTYALDGNYIGDFPIQRISGDNVAACESLLNNQ